MAFAIAAVTALAIAGSAWAVMRRPASNRYYDTRRLVILAHASQNPAPVVVLGDSIVDMAEMPTMCGRAVLNAGVAGARTADVERLAADLLAGRRPELVIVAVGLNDAHRNAQTSDQDFLTTYRAILARARMTGARVRATTIPPVGPSDLGRAGEFDPSRIAALNRLIRQAGVPVLDIHAAMSAPDGIERAGFTTDGVHPNARGYGVWRKVVAQACAA